MAEVDEAIRELAEAIIRRPRRVLYGEHLSFNRASEGFGNMTMWSGGEVVLFVLTEDAMRTHLAACKAFAAEMGWNLEPVGETTP